MRALLITLLFLIPFGAFAAEVTLTREQVPIHAGDSFSVAASINTGTDLINAVEGTLEIPTGVKVSSVRLTGSVVPLWVSPPQAGNVITFAGVLPGGFQGTGTLFTVVLTPQTKGLFSFGFSKDTSAYANDGSGTEIGLKQKSLSVSVEPSSGAPSSNRTPKDVTPPEPFIPLFTAGEPFGADGDVLVFSTQDKDAGVMRFDVARSYNEFTSEKALVWTESRSPYVLQKGDADRFLFVRATDFEGNTRIAKVSPREFSALAFFGTWWLAILVLILIFVILSWHFLRSRGRNS